MICPPGPQVLCPFFSIASLPAPLADRDNRGLSPMPSAAVSRRAERYFNRFHKMMMPIVKYRHPDWTTKKREREVSYLWSLCERQVQDRISEADVEINYEAYVIHNVWLFLLASTIRSPGDLFSFSLCSSPFTFTFNPLDLKFANPSSISFNGRLSNHSLWCVAHRLSPMPSAAVSRRAERYFNRFHKMMMPIVKYRHPDWTTKKREREVSYLWSLCERQVQDRISEADVEINYEAELIRFIKDFLKKRQEERFFFICFYGGVSCDGSDGDSGVESD
nr:hypothetical transcript [Hymenolepis microstoma]